MRYAFMLLGLMTLILFVGALVVFTKKGEGSAEQSEQRTGEYTVQFRE